MSKIKNSFLALVLCSFLLGAQVCIADDVDVLIPSVVPDVLLLLDLSGSMNTTPAGYSVYASSCSSGYVNSNSSDGPYHTASATGHTALCEQPWDPTEHGAIWGDSTCAGPFYKTSGEGHTKNCSKVQLAKDAIIGILDADASGTVTSPTDDDILGVRIGYGNFYLSNVTLPVVGIGSNYSAIWTALSPAIANGSTPLAALLSQAKTYLDTNKAADSAKDCRNKFAILITDGEDTLACSGNGSETQTNQYKRRRETVAKAKALSNAGYKVFIVGFGASMPHYLKNTLNWAAFYGGTDNPSAENSGDTGAYNPSSVTSCQTSTTAHHNINGEGDHYYATTNDPGEIPLSGYAFTATDSSSLQTALQTAIAAIKNSAFSFSVSSVSSPRTALDNFVYAASFQPMGDPFWPGSITRSSINADGSLTAGWEAGSILNGNSSRNIQTYTGGNLRSFSDSAWGTWTTLLGVDTNTVKVIIPYIRGEATPDNWKLGDIFHSSPITIGKPNPYFEDPRDTNKRYDLYRDKSSIKNRAKIILEGANDGQLHAFDGDTGSEVWSFIPPNLLPKLRYLVHASHPTILPHQFFVDGPISAAEVWVGTGNGTAKGDNEWSTYLIFGEGKGVRDNTSTAGHTSYLWSSSPSCDQNFNVPPNSPAYVYTATYKYYCGYHALDVTATGSTPAYKWIINSDASTKAVSSSHGPYLGEPWSKMAIGKVLISGNETWVGFIGGGYGQSGNAGKGFFVVDLKDGHILWSRTAGDTGYSAMSYIPASPMIVDTDLDGFIDTAYAGDLSGNMWRFTFCTTAQGSSCGTGSGSGNWSGGLFFQPSTTVPIYTAAKASRDFNSNLWVFWGTGDKMTPNNTSSGSAGKFFAVKDNSRSGNWTESDLQDISAYTDTSPRGWSITLGSGGEKMLSDPTVFGGMLLFTTYFPYAGTNPCVTAGTAYLYAVAMQRQPVRDAGIFNTGAGLLGSGARSVSLGSGIASAPAIAQSSPAAPPSLFVSVSGGTGIVGTTATTLPTVTKTKLDFDQNSGLIKGLADRVSTQILNWRDGRIQ